MLFLVLAFIADFVHYISFGFLLILIDNFALLSRRMVSVVTSHGFITSITYALYVLQFVYSSIGANPVGYVV